MVRYHLALRAPGNCFINVAGEDYHWVEGEGVMFDDAFDHYVHADEERAILFVDILRPLRGTARLLQSIANALNYYSPASGASKV